MNGRRYCDAGDLKTLARMLDEALRERPAGAESGLSLEARAVGTVLAGDLVQALANGAVRRADAKLERGADGVAGAASGDGRVRWAPLGAALMNVEGSPARTGAVELWLSSGGRATAAKPASGYVQKVGVVIGYDQQKKTCLCLVRPEPAVVVY